MKLLLRWLIATAAILLAAYIVPGIAIASFLTAIIVALVLGIINAVIKPFLILLTLPINIITLGLFTLVINALLVLLTAAIIPGFSIAGFWDAMLFSIVLSIITFFLNKLLPDKD